MLRACGSAGSSSTSDPADGGDHRDQHFGIEHIASEYG